jgi:two-component system, CAI-1 autoinducer sensor kinase/phosphatase CqsS
MTDLFHASTPAALPRMRPVVRHRFLLRAIALLRQPLEPLRHLSRARLVALSLVLFVGHLAFHGFWSQLAPQPYENPLGRALAAIGALPLLWWTPAQVTRHRAIRLYLLVYLTYTGPFLFQWFYLMNHGNAVWMTSTALMCFLVYQVLDWRVATATLAVGTIAARAFVSMTEPQLALAPWRATEGNLTFFFAWLSALTLALSSASHRLQRLNATLLAMGVMAHELRTPLASAALLNDHLRDAEPADVPRLADRMDGLLRAINHQIDSQIVNAQLLDILPGHETLDAARLVRDAIDSYPFMSERERQAVSVNTRGDFHFTGNERLFIQVIHNMVKNSVYALRRTQAAFARGDIEIEVDAGVARGTIRVRDKGPGVPEHVRRFIFEPFFSTQTTHSSGLGLAFCRETVEANRGQLRFERVASGSCFVIELPLATP